ncbi:hypothetical protein [Sphingobium sp. CR28]|uniref:hypothetical protein n=1 Tax=Sphingobium sp. CR28 TaxID=3400272 RepID=UPI003FED5DCE
MLFAISLGFLLRFADNDGYEGDDLNSILPMAHLDAAKAGMLLLYRYAWQPLSYEVGALVWRLFGTPDAVFTLAPVCGAFTLALLSCVAWREARGTAPLVCALVAILAEPELFYSSLYFNSTILAMPLGAGALLLLRGRTGMAGAVFAGFLTALAVMMRLDFVLVCPLFAMAAWEKDGTLKRPVFLGVVVIAILGGAAAIGFLDLSEIARIQSMSVAEIAEKANVPGWDRRVKILVAVVSVAPAGWILLFAGATLAFERIARHRDFRVSLWAIAALPALYPLLNMLSPKYLLPLTLFLVPFFAWTASNLVRLSGRHSGGVAGALLAGAALPFIFAVALQKSAPFLRIETRPSWSIGTHDGPRALGGYLWQMMATNAEENRTEDQRVAARIVTDWLQGPPGDTLFLGGENYFDAGGMGWRHVQLILEKRRLQGKLTGPHQLTFVQGDRRLILAVASPPILPASPRIIDRRSEPHEP